MGSCTLLSTSQLESFTQIIFLKPGFVQIVVFLTCFPNNYSPVSRTALCILDSTRHFVSNSVLRFLQNWTSTVVPGDSLLSSFPVHSSSVFLLNIFIHGCSFKAEQKAAQQFICPLWHDPKCPLCHIGNSEERR